MKKLIFLLFAVSAYAQVYTATKTTSLSSSAEVITIQQPASGSKHVVFVGANIDCTSQILFTIERNGTAATSTTLAVAKSNTTDATPTATAWSGSNVGTSTVQGTYICSANSGRTIDLTQQTMDGNNTGVNLTLRTASGTATVYITIMWREI